MEHSESQMPAAPRDADLAISGRAPTPFPVLAIGASADGLESLELGHLVRRIGQEVLNRILDQLQRAYRVDSGGAHWTTKA